MRGAFEIVDNLRDGDLRSLQTDCADGIRRCTEIMQSLLDDVQDSIKLQPASRPLNRMQTFQWRALLDEVLLSLLPVAQDQNLELRARILAPKVDSVQGDRESIGRLATLLVEHGMRFAPRGGVVALESSLVPGQAAKAKLYRLSVAQTLPGEAPARPTDEPTDSGKRQLVVRQCVELGGCGIVVEHVASHWKTTSWFDVPLRAEATVQTQ